MVSPLTVIRRPLVLLLFMGLTAALSVACRNGEESPLAQGDQAQITCSD